MSLSIFKTEQLKLRISDSALGLADVRCDLRKFIGELLELSLQDTTFCARVHIAKCCIRMCVDIFLDAANSAIKVFCLATIPSIQSIVFIGRVFILEINCVQKHLLLTNLLSQLVQRYFIVGGC